MNEIENLYVVNADLKDRLRQSQEYAKQVHAAKEYGIAKRAEARAELESARAKLAAVEALEGDARERLFEGVFELVGKYDIDVTNSPDMRPGVPEAGDLCGDVLDLFRATISAALTTVEADEL